VLLDRLLGGPGAERWYSFVYDYCYWRGVQGAVQNADTWRRLTQGVVILNYHAFGSASEQPGRFIVPARRFARQMRWLRLAGYRVVSLRALVEERRDNQLAPSTSVAITLDDGYADTAVLAYPILHRLRLRATLFLVSGAVGGPNDWDADGELAHRPLLSWSTLRKMAQDGLMEYGAHTRSHSSLPSLPHAEARAEMERGRNELEEQLGGPISVLAYPYGARDVATDHLAEDIGFHGACGTEPGPNTPATPRYALRRTEVRGTDSLLRFALTLWLGELPRRDESRRLS
jgi:peptidoglycan/xylan/chitin deacetylase (PgdA/CDA1 family)